MNRKKNLFRSPPARLCSSEKVEAVLVVTLRLLCHSERSRRVTFLCTCTPSASPNVIPKEERLRPARTYRSVRAEISRVPACPLGKKGVRSFKVGDFSVVPPSK